MKPEDGAKNFFAEMMSPIAAADVKQFVAGNRGLEARIQRCKTLRQKHDWREKTERDGRAHLGGETKLRRSSQENAHSLENSGGFRSRVDGLGSLAETAKFEKTECEDGKTQDNSGENQDAKNRSDRLHAGKMPVRGGGPGWREERNGEIGGNCRRDGWWTMPRLDQWEQQTDGDERAPVWEKHCGLLEFEHAREKCAGQDQQGYLDPPEK